MKKLLLNLGLALFLAGLATTVFADAQILGVPAIDQDIFEDTFEIENICGPTSWSEVVGYWGTHGYPSLLRGPLSGEVPDTSEGMKALFIEALDYSGYTDRTYPEPFAAGIREYFSYNGVTVDVIHKGQNQVFWPDLKDELDAGRPVALLVWSWNHWVVLTGYTDDPPTMTALVGYMPLQRTLTFVQLPPTSQIEAVYVRPKGADPVLPDRPQKKTMPWIPLLLLKDFTGNESETTPP